MGKLGCKMILWIKVRILYIASVSKGLLCNGSTVDFDSTSPGSNPGGPTTRFITLFIFSLPYHYTTEFDLSGVCLFYSNFSVYKKSI